MACVSSMGGSRPGRRCASMLLPLPGGPINSRLCSPAAAISSARRAPAWPRTSARSGARPRSKRRRLHWRCGRERLQPARKTAYVPQMTGHEHARLPRQRCLRTVDLRHDHRVAETPGLQGARQHAAHTVQLASQVKARRTARGPRRAPRAIAPEATRMPTAIARSKRPPSFGRSAGARLTVTRPAGKSKPQLESAARTRSLLSLTAVSSSPTTENEGSPGPTSTSDPHQGSFETLQGPAQQRG